MEGRTIPLAVQAMAGALLLVGLASPLVAQTVIRGRVEDAVSRRPLVGVDVFSSDSSTAAITDSAGTFTLRVPSYAPLTVVAGRVGYLTYRFELPENAPSRMSVLLLEPAPIEVEGIDIVGESAVTEVLRDLGRRRNSYPHAMRAFDATQLQRLGRFGSLWDFVRTRAYRVFECTSAPSGLCAREGRGRRSVYIPPEDIQVMVCIDGRASWGAATELNGFDVGSVALVEIYRQGRDGIRVYTPGYITASARRGRHIGTPQEFGC